MAVRLRATDSCTWTRSLALSPMPTMISETCNWLSEIFLISSGKNLRVPWSVMRS